ncbi:MAG: anhydro-N-acetylmuramic acid kinase [Alphaproteobacteria bacterium]|nr:MAG: anhydro-N-acetylmuramic acid kinase [Alphaproteobacteria bacterium]
MNDVFDPIYALGMMSGTSLDGVDLCLIRTDGEQAIEVEGRHYRAYPPELKARLLEVSRGDIPLADVLRLEKDVTEEYAAAVVESGLLHKAQLVGCHGQTVRHMPQEGLTWQLGDANRLAERLSEVGYPVPVVMDFRRRDMAAGGEGAPLAPLFHAIMMGKLGRPAAMLNIGGVANVTVVDAAGNVAASDCGPGMGMLDSWMQERVGEEFDRDGMAAKQGKVDAELVIRALADIPFFERPLPRSADRYEFYGLFDEMKNMRVEDGAATLSALTVEGIDLTLRGLGMDGAALTGLYVSGGGAYNPVVMDGLAHRGWNVQDSKVLGWDPLAVEAACFAWLAVRRLRGLTTTLPTTTKCKHPTVGGVVTA